MTIKEKFADLEKSLSSTIIGQSLLVNRLLIALLADGHLLVEGAPGLAKTRAIKALSDDIEGDFHRIQFTPDLLPADLTGTDIYRPQEARFDFQPGPLFHNVLLADEINRAPAKVQSALLEAMAERQVSVGKKTYPLPEFFLVMATQNPIEQEGTYPLPEAQLDRFLMHVEVDYPSEESEQKILQLVRSEWRNQSGKQSNEQKHLSQSDLFQARNEVLDVFLAENLESYLLQLVLATRSPQKYGQDLERWIEYGVSPRASLALDRCSRAHAWLQGRDFVSPDDIQEVAHDIMRHRVLVSYEAEAEGVNSNQVINEILSRVAVP